MKILPVEIQLWEGDGEEPAEHFAYRMAEEERKARERAAEAEKLRKANLERHAAGLRQKSVWTLAAERVEVRVAGKGWKCLLSRLVMPPGIPIKQRFRRLTLLSPMEEDLYRQMPYGFTFENPIITDLDLGNTSAMSYRDRRPPSLTVEATEMKPIARILAKKWAAAGKERREVYSNLGIHLSPMQREMASDMTLAESITMGLPEDWNTGRP